MWKTYVENFYNPLNSKLSELRGKNNLLKKTGNFLPVFMIYPLNVFFLPLYVKLKFRLTFLNTLEFTFYDKFTFLLIQ